MSVEWRRLLRGRAEGRGRRWLTFAGGYAAAAAAGTAARLARPPTSGAPPVLYEDPLVTALLVGPIVVAAVAAARGGGLALGLAVGATPALAYGAVLAGATLVSTGGVDGAGELLAHVGASAAVGLVAGLIGWAVGAAVRRRGVRNVA